MNSSTSNFKSILIAAAAVVVIELVYFALYQPDMSTRNNLLSLSYAKADRFGRLVIHDKIAHYDKESVHILQTGDSSGFMGIRPLVVEEYLPDGVNYVNLSCCSNIGFRGYMGIFTYFLERHPEMEAIVIYHTPLGNLPGSGNWDDGGELFGDNENLAMFGADIYKTYASNWTFLQFPTLDARIAVTDYLYSFGRLVLPQGRDLSTAEGYRVFRERLIADDGYMPHIGGGTLGSWGVQNECTYPEPQHTKTLLGAEGQSYLDLVYGEFVRLAESYDVKLILAYQVVPCPVGQGNGTRAIREELEAFMQKHPDVIVPFDLADSWPKDKFAVPAHVKHEYSEELSRRLGEALRPHFADLAVDN